TIGSRYPMTIARWMGVGRASQSRPNATPDGKSSTPRRTTRPAGSEPAANAGYQLTTGAAGLSLLLVGQWWLQVPIAGSTLLFLGGSCFYVFTAAAHRCRLFPKVVGSGGALLSDRGATRPQRYLYVTMGLKLSHLARSC